MLPGLSLQAVAIVLWAFEESTGIGWAVAAISVAVAGTATVLKYTHPGRRLRAAGVPTWAMALSVVAGVIGFFAIPVVGAVVGFVLALYVFERARVGGAQAWPSTKTALTAIAQSIGIELAAGFVIIVVFVAGIFLA